MDTIDDTRHSHLLEGKINDCLEEHSAISDELQQKSSGHVNGYSRRMGELELQIQALWRKYQTLTSMID